MDAHFQTAMNRLLILEGINLTNSTGDKGGQTFCGISRVYHPEWIGWAAIDANDIEKANLLVNNFYYENYWKPLLCDRIDSFEVAFFLFQFAVNVGAKTAVHILQMAVQTEIIDGIMGPHTLFSVNSLFPEKALILFKGYAAKHYVSIAEADYTQYPFLYSWLSNRVFKTYT